LLNQETKQNRKEGRLLSSVFFRTMKLIHFSAFAGRWLTKIHPSCCTKEEIMHFCLIFLSWKELPAIHPFDFFCSIQAL